MARTASNQRIPGGPFQAALAVGCHPDDIEFHMAGTLVLLGEAGWDIHYMNVADGARGSATGTAEEVAATRRAEARESCRRMGAHFHESVATDMEVYHTTEIVAKVLAVIRSVRPRILLVHSPTDYMEDHVNACRVAVTAAFARGMATFSSIPPVDPISEYVTIYHALPYGMRDPLRRVVRAGQYVDTASVMEIKRHALAAHASQKQWLEVSQGISYLDTMADLNRDIGTMSGRFEYAEGWRRRNHMGFAAADEDPLTEALGEKCFVDEEYEASLGTIEPWHAPTHP